MGKIIFGIPAVLQDCQDVQGDITKITTWAEPLFDPGTFVQTCIMSIFNHKDFALSLVIRGKTLFEKITGNIGEVYDDIDALKADFSGG